MSNNNSTNFNQLSGKIRELEENLAELTLRIRNSENDTSNNSILIKQLKNLDDKWNENTEGSYDPQIPYYIHRKNEQYDYRVITFNVTDADITNKLDSYGNIGWMVISMGMVDAPTSTSEITFKRIENSIVRFNYLCFKYEVKATKQFSETLNQQNKNGYEFTTTAGFNKSASFCLMTKVIY
jgi:hypothetical protein